MAKRITPEKSTHDRKVREKARELKKQDYEVRAAIRGYDRPRPIGKEKRIPDIEARKRGVRKIIEVETPGSLRTDKEQLKTFTRHAAHKKGTTFEVIVTRPRKAQPKSSLTKRSPKK